VSRVAVQLALGGTYRAVEVHRVPLPDLYAIYMRAMRLYVHSTTTPSDLRDQLTAACVSLIDVPGGPAIQWTDCGSILNAFASAGIGPEDPDRDTWVETDNCPDEYNPYQEDLDDDGVGDACEEEPPGTLPPGPAIVQRLGVRERRTGITVPDALVLIRYEDALVASCRTDFGGGCQVDLPPGDYEAIARHPAWPDGSLRFSNPDTDPPRSSWLFQDVLVGTGEIDIVAVSGYVTLHDPDDPGPCALRELTGGGCDVPLPGVRVSLESASGAILVEDATRDVHAWFRLQGGLEAGVQYLAQARYPGYAVSRYATALSDSSTITWQPIMRPTNDECVTDPDAFVVLDGSIGAQGARVWMGPIGTGPDERPQSTAPDAAVICLGGAPARPAFRWNTAWMAGRMERVTQITVSVDDTLQWSLSSAAGLDPGVVYGQETGGTVGGIEPAPPLPSGVPIDVQVTGPTSAPEHSGRAVLQWRTP